MQKPKFRLGIQGTGFGFRAELKLQGFGTNKSAMYQYVA